MKIINKKMFALFLLSAIACAWTIITSFLHELRIIGVALAPSGVSLFGLTISLGTMSYDYDYKKFEYKKLFILLQIVMLIFLLAEILIMFYKINYIVVNIFISVEWIVFMMLAICSIAIMLRKKKQERS